MREIETADQRDGLANHTYDFYLTPTYDRLLLDLAEMVRV